MATASVQTPPRGKSTRLPTVDLRRPDVVVRQHSTRQRTYIRTIAATDFVVIALAVVGGYLARFSFAGPIGVKIPYGLVAPALALTWLLFLRALRCYDPRVLGYGADEYRRVAGASLRLAGAIAIASTSSTSVSPGASWRSRS